MLAKESRRHRLEVTDIVSHSPDCLGCQLEEYILEVDF
jgi:hypothetical protein